MNRKIFLDGHLGKEITPVLDFCGDSVAEAFRCIQANYPDFRKYLIEAHEQDIGFSVEIQGRTLEDPRECLLPFREGDIIITPVIGGSKSGGGKILAAAAIAAVLFVPGGANLLLYSGAKAIAPTSLASGLSAAGGAYATAGLIASGLAVNLALTGIQQLMAPDPSVDSDPEESYLFNGGQRNVSEGDPVPVLYGELRVPGMPVSLNIDQDDYKSGSDIAAVNTWVDTEGNVTDAAENKANDANVPSSDSSGGLENINDPGQGVDIDSASEFNNVKSNAQYITAVDIISEGPIYGLVNGSASVYFDDKPLADASDSPVYASATSADFTFNGTTTVTSANVPSNLDFGDFTEKRYLIGIGGETGTTSSVAKTLNWPNNSRLDITTSTTIFDTSYTIGSGDSVVGRRESYTIVNLIDSEGQVVASGPIEARTSGSSVRIATEGFVNILTDVTATYSVRVDVAHEIASYSSGTFTLASASTLNGTFKGNISGNSIDSGTTATSKYKNTTPQFRTGTLGQAPIISKDSSLSSASAVTTSVSNAIVGPDDTGTQVYEYAGSDFYSGGTVDKYTQTDLVKILFNYPALYNRSDKGATQPGQAFYKIEVALATDSAGSTFGAYQPYNLEVFHGGTHTSPISFLETIDLNKFGTFTNFKIRVTRESNIDAAANYGTNGPNVDGYEGTSAATITQLTAVISEPLTWPYTAYAHTRFSTRDFPNNPKRTYLCRGMKVLVPDTYTTREKSSTGVASYSGTWSGAFKAEKEYTNNPAWVFYDMVVNNRYGLGNWIQETDIDKFALYRIAKYCDELVPDGNGGQEPRFTSNVYLTKATDAYKVLKDLATIFRGMLYWLDGQIYAVSDRAGDPIYNFSKGNVIDGTFAYEGTGNRTRSNQVIVTWNNPSSDYRQEALIVEDRENIIKTSKIISENAVAFGATSEGQALRYGRWKLWTAINQTEIVSFKTAINAAFLMPGDIIQVQDADRHPGDVRYSGRISSTGTLSTTQVPLDSFVELNVGSTYELSVLITSPGAFLNQDTAIISTTVYNRGDLIPGITTESAASNLTDDSGDNVQVTWSEYTRVESQSVSTGAGTVNALTVSSPFTVAPQAQNVWALRETNSDGLPVLGSAKSYKILSITEDSKNEYSITAVEHYNEKFDSIDDDFVLSVTDPVNPPLEIDDSIPPPKNLKMILENLDNGTVANDGTLSWDAPDYGFIGGYRITHTFGPKFQPSYLVSRDTTTVTGFNLPLGTYTVFVQTVATNGNRSRAASVTFGVGVEKETVVSRLFGVPIGATASQDIDIEGTNLQFEANTYVFTTKGNPAKQYEFTSGATSTYIQSVSGVPSQNFSAMGSDVERRNNSHFIYFDASNTSDPLRLVKYYNDAANNVWYLYDTGTGSGSPSSYWSAGSGTISVPAGSSTITGSGTSFLTDFAVGGYIKSGSTVATVTQINSNTELLVNLINSDTAISGAAYEKPQFNVDINNDCIFGYVRNDSGTSPSLRFYPMELTIKPEELATRTVRLESDDYSVVYDTSTSPDTIYISNGTSPPTITVTATQTGFVNPVYRFKVNGAEFPAGSPEWVTDNFITGPVPATLADWNTGFFGSNPVVVTVEVAEDTPIKEVKATDSVSIFAVADGVDGNDGIDGYTVINTNSAHVFPAQTDGTVTSYTGSGTTFEVFKGATELEGITTGTPTAGEYKITASATNITASSTNGAGVSPGGAITFSDHSGMTGDTAEITYTFDLEGTSSGTQKQTFTVGKQGVPGTSGKVVRLEADDYSVVYDTSTSPDTIYISNGTSPPTITVTATPSGFTNPIYRFKVNGAEFPAGSPEWVSNNSISGPVPATLADWNTGFFGSNPVIVSVEVSENTSPEVIEAADSVSIFAVAEGVDGADGIDGYTVVLTNAAHSFTSDAAGNVSSYLGSGTDIEVFKGATELNSVTGTPTAGEFSVSVSASNITAGTTSVAANKFTIGDHSSMSVASDTANIIYTLNIENLVTGEQKQTFSKSKQGTSGQTFFQTSAPSGQGEVEGDIWFDSDDGFKIYRYQGSPLAWVNIQDQDINQALLDAAEALGTMQIFVQTTQPSTSGRITGDIWIDISGSPAPPAVPYTYSMLYRWDGSSWVAASADLIGRAHIDALNAIDAADAAQTTADGKIVSFVQATAPTADGVGDFWLDTDDNNKLYRWSGSAWVEYEQAGNLANAVGNLDDIADGSTFFKADANQIAGASRGFNALDSNSDYTRSISTSTIAVAGANPTSGVVIDNAGLRGYSSSTLKFNISTSGTVELKGDLITDGQVFSSGNYVDSDGGACIYGKSDGSQIAAIFGYNDGSSGAARAVYGYASGNGAGVYARSGVGGASPTGFGPALDVGVFGTGYAISVSSGDIRLNSGFSTTDVVGNVDFNNAVTCSSGLTVTGAITATGDITAFFTSDERLKDNTVKISNPLEKVSQLGGYEFDWNYLSPYEGMHDIGVIAQEVLKVAPEAVTRRDNDMLAVRYEKLVPLLIEAIKELKEEVEELKRGSAND